MKTYGLKRVNGIHNPDLLGEIVVLEEGRLGRMRTELSKLEESGPTLPAGTPNRNRIHQTRLTQMRKRVKYKEKLIERSKARQGRLVLAEQAEVLQGRIQSMSKLAATHPTILDDLKTKHRVFVKLIKEDLERAVEFEAVCKEAVKAAIEAMEESA